MNKNCSNKKSSSYHHGNLKEELLKLTLKTIQSNGIEAVTLRSLSEQLGTSRTAIYRHFSSKDDLVQNVLDYGFEILEHTISPIFEMKEKSVTNRLFIMGELYIKFALEQPNLYRILFGDKYKIIREDSCDLEENEQTAGFHSLVSLFIEGQEKKIFKQNDPVIQAITVHTLVHGIASLYIDGHLHMQNNIEELYKTSFDMITKGVLI